MSGILHKAENALHSHHHDQNKSAQQGTFTPQEGHSDKLSHHQTHNKPHISQEERDRLDFSADRGFDHAAKGSKGPGVGFEE